MSNSRGMTWHMARNTEGRANEKHTVGPGLQRETVKKHEICEIHTVGDKTEKTWK